MEARTGNGPSPKTVAPPRDRLLPLSLVEFKLPVQVDGFPHPIRKWMKGTKVLDTGAECPKLFIDPELQAIVINGRHFPMVDVKYYERAKAA